MDVVRRERERGEKEGISKSEKVEVVNEASG
jgi:hypothetical protein